MSQAPYWTQAPPYDEESAMADGNYFSWPLDLPPNIHGANVPAPMVPNMLPYSSAFPSAPSDFDTTSFNSFPYTNQYPVMAPYLHGEARPFQDDSNPMASLRTVLARPMGAAQWTNPPGSPIPTFTVANDVIAGQRRSRLPPNDTARKVPRKADNQAINNPLLAQDPQPERIAPVEPKVKSNIISGRVTKPANERKRKTSVTPTPVTQPTKPTRIARRDTPKPRKPAQPKLDKVSSKKRDTATSATGRRKHTIEDEDDDESDVPLRTMRPRRVTKADEENEFSAQPTTESEVVPCPRQISQAPQVKLQPRVETTSIRPPLTHKPRGPFPRCQYEVPDSLKGIQQAMGPDNWNEYVVLLEKLWTREMHGEDFAAASKAILSLPNENMRKKMNSRMLKHMIAPVLDKHMAEKEKEKGKGKEMEDMEMEDARQEAEDKGEVGEGKERERERKCIRR
ncbi:hypothetical protein NX059_010577 [Plenodomus lindquistii]|nr:hypothetical protein NX059_010577 [Plenodomus lindquistii]